MKISQKNFSLFTLHGFFNRKVFIFVTGKPIKIFELTLTTKTQKMMRTLLLFVFALAFMGSTMAQKPAYKAVPYGKTAHPSAVTTLDINLPNSTVANIVQTNRPKSANAVIDTVKFGSSKNVYSLLLPDQTCLWYDYNLDALMFTYRGNNSTAYPFMTYLTGNDLVNNYSLDLGNTWTKKAGAIAGTYMHRYPQGVIYNPAGNTDINNTFAVMQGPATDAVGWAKTYMASVKYDGSSVDEQLVNIGVNTELLRQGLTATEDGKLHFCGDEYLGDYTSSNLMTRYGTFNAGNTIDWTNVDIDLNDVITRQSDNTLLTFFGDAHMAWNNDGSVGYVMVRGSDNRPDDKPSWVPIIFKSVDGGATWDQLPYFDFSTLTEITDWILPVKGGDEVYKPMFQDMDITVDANGKPHVFAVVRGAAARDVDSLTYIWTVSYGDYDNDADNNFFEVWQDASDNWNAYHIDTCWTDDVTADESPYVSSTDPVGWDHRIQASRSYDGTKIFCTYTDSEFSFWNPLMKFNLNPDLFIFGHNLNNGQMVGPINVTGTTSGFEASDLWGISFFNYTSPVSIKNTDDSYDIPVTVADINSTGLNADNPVYHSYVKGVTLDFPVGISDNHISNTKVSACYPNPSNGTSYFNVTVDNNSKVSATITNVAGQTLSSKDFGLVVKGTQKLGIDNSNLNSGVYFLNILVGDQKFTNKMIVK